MIPPKRVLVGIDFSEPSRTALAFAARLALQTGADLDVLHVQEPMLTAAAHATQVDLAAQSAEELRQFIHHTPPADACNPGLFVIGGTPGTVLCDIAARERADILVVGAHGMSGPSRWLFGSNTDRVLRHARMSVLVVPAAWHPAGADTRDLSGLGPVIAAVNFTEPALIAAGSAAHLARVLDTRLTLLHVVPELHVLDRWAPYAKGAAAEAARSARVELDGRLSRLNAIAPAHLDIVVGDIAKSILDAAQPHNSYAPLLVVGRRPGDASERSFGTVVSRMLASLPVPMLVVNPSDGMPRT